MKRIILSFALTLHVVLVFGQNGTANQPAKQEENWQKQFFGAPSDVMLPILYEAAINNSAELELAEIERRVASNQLKLAKRELLRNVSASAAYGYGTMINRFDESQMGQWLPFNLNAAARYSIGLSIGYNLEQLTGGRRIRVQTQELALSQSDANRKLRERAIRNSVISLYQNLVMSKAVLDHAQKSLQTAFVSHNMAEKQFREGEIRIDAQMAVNEHYNSAVLTQVQARSNYETAMLMLEETIGVTLNDLMKGK